jgi:hypothetical protein
MNGVKILSESPQTLTVSRDDWTRLLSETEALECGSSSYRLRFVPHTGKASAAATAPSAPPV